METLYVKFIPSLISDHWLADLGELEAELKKIMPDVKTISSRGFKEYKHYKIQDVFRCSNSDQPVEAEGVVVIELNVIPKNL
ncbi:MAG: hypothetical protein ACLQQ4_14435 [Bacteroidia bacterium]